MPAVSSAALAWLALLAAGLLEIVWSLAMKASEGFTRGWASALTAVAICLSVWLLSVAVKVLPIGTAYAVWTGIGAAGAALFGILLFHEPAGAARIACIALIAIGAIGLKALGAG